MAKSSWGLETAFGSRRVWSGLIGDRGCAARPSSSVQNPILPVRRGARLVLCRADPVHRLAGASDSSCSLAGPPWGVVAQAKAEQGGHPQAPPPLRKKFEKNSKIQAFQWSRPARHGRTFGREDCPSPRGVFISAGVARPRITDDFYAIGPQRRPSL